MAAKSVAAAALRKQFIDFFVSKGHTHVPASSVIPAGDPTLLFTNAGMVQFKDCFLGIDRRPYTRAVTAQKCIRAGGKHNDLDNVGHTARHHTFFEMLGNFSFGDYFKEEAIFYAWTFLNKEIGLPAARLSVTVHELDNESRDLWKKITGFSDDKIRRLGDDDNRWSMGEGAGPCGPCTEIFWDQLEEVDGDRFLEIWNVVFMQEMKTADGKIVPLEKKSVDTGMGLERLASVLQEKRTNFQTDIFHPIFAAISASLEKRGLPPVSNETIAAKVLADHCRSTGVLIADGVLPCNVGRGHVLRRIIRRAVRYAYLLGVRDPMMCEIFPVVADSLADAYPELRERVGVVQNVLVAEEASFLVAMSNGLSLLDKKCPRCGREKFGVVNQGKSGSLSVVPAEVAFELHDTFGFPVDVTAMVAKDRNMDVDLAGFELLMNEQRERARKAWKGSGARALPEGVRKWQTLDIKPQFVGYDSLLVSQSQVVAIEEEAGGDAAWIAIDPCPFYAEGGGQVADRGVISVDGKDFDVVDVQKPYVGGMSVLVQGEKVTDSIVCGAKVTAKVDVKRRAQTAAHHTGTHLLHSALRQYLSPLPRQAGSYVGPDRLRFDFSFGRSLTQEELTNVENFVNAALSDRNKPVRIHHHSLDEALKGGAIAQFDEKYGDTVRVVTVDDVSCELCGGTHVSSLGEIWPFKIISESSIAAGTRRIEAVCGEAAVQWLNQQFNTLANVTAALGETSIANVVDGAQTLKKKLSQSEKSLKAAGNLLAELGVKASTQTRIRLNDKDEVSLHLIDPRTIPSDSVLRVAASQAINAIDNNNNVQAVIFVSGDKLAAASRSPSVFHSGKFISSLKAALPLQGGGGDKAAAAKLLLNEKQTEVDWNVLLDAVKKTLNV